MENHFLQNKGNKDFSMLRPLQRKKVTFVTNSTIMTKTGEITSKAIAARIPMADYIRILKEATESGMSMNDWLLLKIYNEESEVIQELKAEIEKQQKQQQKTENLLAEASGEIANLKKEISKISKEGEQVSKSATKLQSDLDKATKEGKLLADENKSLKSKISGLEKQVEEKEAKYAGMMKTVVDANKELKKDLATAQSKYNQVIEKNKEFRSALQKHHDDSTFGIPSVLKLADEKVQIS